jgi:hypothetical protein
MTHVGAATLGAMSVVLAASCDRWLPHSCTEVGCVSGVSVTIRPKTGLFFPGTHEVDVAADGGVVHCSLELSSSLPVNAAVTAVCNNPSVFILVSVRTSCTETTTDTARSLSCVPIPGQFQEVVRIQGTPGSLRITQRASDRTVVDREVVPIYRDTRPNGPDCDPLCRQATSEWEI